MFTTVSKPQNSQSQHAVDSGLCLITANPDHRPCCPAAHQRSPRIIRPKAVLQVHRVPNAVDGEVGKASPPARAPAYADISFSMLFESWERADRSREQAATTAAWSANRLTCSRSTLMLRIEANHRPHQVSLLRPQVAYTTPILRRKRILRRSHIEQYPPILDHGRPRMLGDKKRLQRTRQLDRGGVISEGRHSAIIINKPERGKLIRTVR